MARIAADTSRIYESSGLRNISKGSTSLPIQLLLPTPWPLAFKTDLAAQTIMAATPSNSLPIPRTAAS